MKKKIVALGIVCMFLLVGTISSSANNNIGVQPAGILDKYIIGEGLGLSFKYNTTLFAIAQRGSKIIVEYYYHNLFPDEIITKNVSFALLFLFDGNLTDLGDERFSFEGNCGLSIMI